MMEHVQAASVGMIPNDPRMDIHEAADQPSMAGCTDSTPLPSRTMRDLRHPPSNVADNRKRLFEMKDKIELQTEEFDRYWPYVDNIWVRQHKAGHDKSGRYVTDYYACRLQRPTYTPKQDTPKRDGQPTRKKQIREGGTCQMRLKTIRYVGGFSGYTILRIGDEPEHTHDLDHIDKIKRTSVLMEIAKSEVMKGYMPASVFTVMNENMQNLEAAGGRFLNRNDVRNASQTWRQSHSEELRVHEGYKYDHGNGIVRDENVAYPHNRDNGDANMVDPALTDHISLPPDTLHYPEEARAFLKPYLPPVDPVLKEGGFPHVTLTYATSMDSSLALAPGMQTPLSGPESKAMTHYLRSKHDAIVIGVGTATADDPALNCRLKGAGGYGGLGWEGQPRPVIIDPGARWMITPASKILQTVGRGKGRGPWVIMAPDFAMDPMRLDMLKYYGGKYLGLSEFDKKWRLRWEAILKALAAEGIRSLMIEGGGMVINDLLQPENANLIDSVIVTVAPTYLGRGGVGVSPAARHDHTGRPAPAVRFQNVKWQPLGDDVVMCGKLSTPQVQTAPTNVFSDFVGLP